MRRIYENKVTLKKAKEFHGHLGPYLTLGILAGEAGLKKLKCKKYFGLEVKVWGANEKPQSCIIDGLQLSTGATYGKGNITKLNGCNIKMEFCNLSNHEKINLKLKDDFIQKLQKTKNHRDSEILAKQLYRMNPLELFYLTANKEKTKRSEKCQDQGFAGE